MIAITGANGHLGQAILRQLLTKVPCIDLVAIVRNPETMERFHHSGVTVRRADYNDYQSLTEAFRGVRKVLQISTIGVDIDTANQQEENVVKAALHNGVRHMLYTSMVDARPNAIFDGMATHYRTEELIKASRVGYTFFRNSIYFDVLPEFILGDALRTGTLAYPAGEGKISFASRSDIAEAIANVLASDASESQILELTGSKAWPMHELVKVISTEKNQSVTYTDITADTYRERLAKHQVPNEFVSLLISMANGIRANEFALVDNTLEKLLRRKPQPLHDFVRSL